MTTSPKNIVIPSHFPPSLKYWISGLPTHLQLKEIAIATRNLARISNHITK